MCLRLAEHGTASQPRLPGLTEPGHMAKRRRCHVIETAQTGKRNDAGPTQKHGHVIIPAQRDQGDTVLAATIWE
jgi:hypothetical protein